MKKLLLILSLALIVVSISVSANDNFFYSSGSLNQLKGHVVGVCEIRLSDEFSSESCVSYDLTIDTNSQIVFETPVDTLFIGGGETKEVEPYYDFRDGEALTSDICSVVRSTAYRNDSSDYNSLEVDFENEVEYIKEGATVRFNKPGQYLLEATLGATSGDERILQLVSISVEGNEYYEGYDYYSQPMISFSITVTEAASSETIYDSHYDESIFTVSGITRYDESRVVMNDFRVAVCTAPVTITAQKDLMNIAVAKLINVNGEWKEERIFDGLGFNLGDSTKNWYPADGFEDNYEEPCYEYTGSEDFIEGPIGVNKGKSISFSEPGMYTVWADAVSGEYTGLTFEIGDNIAKYTNSKVLVNGQKVDFEAYNINDNNYFKLRDVAFALTKHGLGKRFNVKWDGERKMINLVSNVDYEAVGGELAAGDGTSKAFLNSTSALLKDGVNVSLMAYLINGNNYFKLRDLGILFDFNVSWDGANNCILIDTTTSYIDQ